MLALEVLSSQSLAGNPAFQVMNSPTHSLRFLVFNPLSDAFGDAAVRQALACMLDQDQAAGQLPGQVLPLKSFVLPGESFWYNPDAPLSCKGLDPGSRLALAIQILKTAGYTWTREPAPDIPGQGLASAAGERLPAVSLIAPSSDAPRAAAASYIEGQARLLGIPLTTQLVSSEQLDYDVFSSHRYDLALLGWRVGAYPGYLCEWFGAGNPFHYDESRLKSLCEALDGTSDLDNARQRVFEIQAVLTQDVPFVPLFSMLKQDAYRGLSYPFDQVLDGLSGVYGAPSLAVPALP